VNRFACAIGVLLCAALPLSCGSLLGLHEFQSQEEGGVQEGGTTDVVGAETQVPGSDGGNDTGSMPGDASSVDSSPVDASPVDASPVDASPVDASQDGWRPPTDASVFDADALAPPSLATPAVVYSGASPVLAASGTPGQRHIVFAAGAWWVFFVGPNQLLGNKGIDSGGSVMWVGLGSGGLSVFPYTFAGTPALDGRGFGVDTRATPGGDVIHISLSGGGLTAPLAHARAIINAMGQAIFGVVPATSLAVTPSTNPDGTVSVIGSSGQPVVDFSSATGSSVTANVAANTESGAASWTFGPGNTSALGGPSVPVRTRAALSLASSDVLLWRASGNIYMAENAGSGWSPTGTLTLGVQLADDTRTFAACVQPSGVAGLLHWTGSAFSFLSLMSGNARGQRAVPAILGGPGGWAPTEMVLACGKSRVHAFAIPADGTNVIWGATWDPISDSWTSWAPVVDASMLTAGKKRCYLTGFDRVAGIDGRTVGLMWSEASDCTVAENPKIWTAYPRVSE
jgi:hypothetical protein